ncbi:hypothetical protein GIB67_029671 [Kingdonia uniflora]|uniref:Selenoprotein O n=1 Tax=Kingdonia uniflora TaxID=39325 RepID=A0A7J7LLS9_9MAGN|nr:hypothetical protein GIB67_029671 [Kingdonia uniflora]
MEGGNGRGCYEEEENMQKLWSTRQPRQTDMPTSQNDDSRIKDLSFEESSIQIRQRSGDETPSLYQIHDLQIEEMVVQQREQNTPTESQDTNLNVNVPLSPKGSKEKESGTKRKSASIPVELNAPVSSGFPASTSAAKRKPLIRFPYARCYGGHQFGSWAGQLGDGLAVLQSIRGGRIALLLCGCVTDGFAMFMILLCS